MENVALNINQNNTNNITTLPSKTLNSCIKVFFDRLAPNSVTQYKSEINAFLSYIFGKGITWENLDWIDIEDESKINAMQLQKYQTYLIKQRKLSNKTVNHHLDSVQTLFNMLSYMNPKSNINPNIFKILKRLPETTNHYGALSEEEIEQLFDFAKQQGYKSMYQYLALRTLYVTGMRKSAVMSLKWLDIVEDYDYETNKNYYKIKNKHDKTKDVTVPLTPTLSEELQQIKPDVINNDTLIFNFNAKTLLKTFNKFCEEYNLDKEGRNLSLHSIKHTGVLKVKYESGNDLEKVRQYAKHSDLKTTSNYLNEDGGLSDNPNYTFDDKVDFSVIENASKEDLINAIKNCCSKGIQIQLCNFLKK